MDTVYSCNIKSIKVGVWGQPNSFLFDSSSYTFVMLQTFCIPYTLNMLSIQLVREVFTETRTAALPSER